MLYILLYIRWFSQFQHSFIYIVVAENNTVYLPDQELNRIKMDFGLK